MSSETGLNENPRRAMNRRDELNYRERSSYPALLTKTSRMSGERVKRAGVVTALLSVLCVLLGRASAADLNLYAIQPSVDIFVEEPQSRAVLAGSTVSFVCNTSAVVVANNYLLPTIQWRVNGSETLPGSNWEATMTSSTSSELTVREVELADAGYVECLVKDGISRVRSSGEFVNQDIFITSSRRARLDVITVSEDNSTASLSVCAGQSLLLPCVNGTPHRPGSVQWYRNGQELHASESAAILSDGALLILSLSSSDSAHYQCQAWFGPDTVNSTVYAVTVDNGSQCSGPPELLLDVEERVALQGKPLSLSCFLTGTQGSTAGYDLEWLKDGEPINSSFEGVSNITSDSRRSTLHFTAVDQSHSGTYQCKISNTTINTNSTIKILVPATFEDYYIGLYNQVNIPIKLIPPSPAQDVYCYKNGRPLEDIGLLFDRTTNKVSLPDAPVSVEEVEAIAGIYQCFAEHATGSVHSTTRVLRNGFVNPPSNLKCELEPGATTSASVTLSWSPPTLNTKTNTGERYIASYPEDGVIQYRDAVIDRTDYISGLKKNVYTFSVKYQNLVDADQSAPVQCLVITEHRATLVEHHFTASCSDNPPAVTWENPAYDIEDLELEKFNITGMCIYGEETVKKYETVCVGFSFECDGTFDPPGLLNKKTLGFDLLTDNGTSLPNGTVCLFKGSYDYANLLDTETERITTIPKESCVVQPNSGPPSSGPVSLGVSCSRSNLIVSWQTMPSNCSQFGNLTITGRCLNLDGLEMFDELNATEPAGVSTLLSGRVPEGAICSVYGSFHSSSGEQLPLAPVPCIVGEEAYYLLDDTNRCTEVTSSDVPMATTITSDVPMATMTTAAATPTATAQPSQDFPAYLWAPIIFGVALIGVVISVVVVLILCLRRNSMRQSKKLQEITETVAEHFKQQQIMNSNKLNPYQPELITVWPSTADNCDAASEVTDITALKFHREFEINEAGSDRSSVDFLVNTGDASEEQHFMMDRFFQSQDGQWVADVAGETNSIVQDSGLPEEFHSDTQLDAHSQAALKHSESEPQPTTLLPRTAHETETASECPGESAPELPHVIVHSANSTSTCSSGYATYFASSYGASSSMAQTTSSYFTSKVRELELEEEEAERERLSPQSEPSDTDTGSSDAGELCSHDSVFVAKSLAEPSCTEPDQQKESGDLCSTAHERNLLSPSKPDDGDYSPRSQCSSAYCTDDEGYVHMGSALIVRDTANSPVS